MSESYGKAWLDGGVWKFSGEPHVLMQLKRIFGRIWVGEHEMLTLKDTDEIRKRVKWFLIEYPMEVSAQDERLLADGAARHKSMILRLNQIIDTNHVGRAYKMAIPPREYQKVGAEVALEHRGLLIADDLGTGKAQPLDAKVLTPEGWRPIGSLHIGSEIIDPDGGIAQVSGIFHQGKKPVYRVTTKDGASTECCEDHLWLLYTHNDRTRGTSRILPLRQFKDDLRRTYGKNRDIHVHVYFLPVTQPVQFAQTKALPMNPYLLGALLGDGTLKDDAVLISKNDTQFIDMVRAALPEGVEMVHVAGPDWRMRRSEGAQTNRLLDLTRELGLSGKKSQDKFIPVQYLSASVDDRKALLAGLMDSDGTTGKDGSVAYSSSSERLILDVRELIWSLGGYATLTSRIPTYTYKGDRLKGRRSYTLHVYLPFNPFRLDRKGDRRRDPLMVRAIQKVELVGQKETLCISTTSKRKLYITDDYIVTHNTISALAILTEKSALPAVVVTPANTMPEQWRNQCWRFLPDLFTHVVKKGTPYVLPKMKGRGPDVIIINYHKLNGWAEVLAAYGRCVIFDEVQELRRRESAKYAAAEVIAGKMKYKIALSATPIFNLGGEIWNIVNVLKPDSLGSWEEFLREWCYGEKGDSRKAPAVKDPKALGSYLMSQHLMLRRTRKDVGRELPQVTKIIQTVDHDEKAFSEIEDKVAALARIIVSSNKIDNFERMRAKEEFDNKMRQATGISKAPYVAEFIRLLVTGSGEAVVVFAWHRGVYDILMSKLKDLDPAMFTGSETAAQKKESIDRFLSGKTSILLMSLRSGQGIDGLQKRCRTVVIAELDWTNAVMEQDIGRVDREGQADPVTAYFLVSESGSDPKIAETLGIKQSQLDGIRDPHRGIIAELQVDKKDRIREMAQQYLDRTSQDAKAGA